MYCINIGGQSIVQARSIVFFKVLRVLGKWGGGQIIQKILTMKKKDHLNPIPCGGVEEGRIVYQH